MGNICSLWQLLRENLVTIPIIQRDYAQGRIGKESLRKNFLISLRDSLLKSRPIQLDFVYGAVENNGITPLDGQQRLTTLWLVHWYIAYKSGALGDGSKNSNIPMNEVASTLLNFSYETRDSSRDFCRKLVTFTIQAPKNLTISEHIENQNWFSSYWKQDPTIQSMLRMLAGSKDKDGKQMLDGIEQVFANLSYSGLWEKLTDNNCPITFYYLNLAGLKQTDDLYLKMNARGEQLTDFENLKADLSEYLFDLAEKEKERNQGERQYTEMADITTGFPVKMDRDWANLFWNGENCDEAYMAFLNRFFLTKVILQKEHISLNESSKTFKESYKYSGSDFEEDAKSHSTFFDYFYGRSPVNYIGDACIDDSRIAYSDFSIFRYVDDNIPPADLLSLENTLDGYLRFLKITGLDDIKELSKSSWGETFDFIPEYDGGATISNFKNEDIHKVKGITQNGRVLFYAVCRFMEQVTDQDKDTLIFRFKRWMRIVWNLISDVRMRSITAMVNQLQLVDVLSPGAMDIYEKITKMSVTKSENEDGSILSEHLEEEKAKAEKINRDSSWEEKVVKYEGKKLSKGTIRYLFTNDGGQIDWEDFDKKAENLPWDEVVEPEKNHLRTFVSCCSDWDELKAIMYDFRQTTWISNLTNKRLSKVVHNYLLGNPTQFVDKNASHTLTFENLTKTALLSNLWYGEEHIKGSKLRDDKYDLIALFPDRAVSEMKKYVLGNSRNEILARLIKEEHYSCGQRVNSTELFWGWDLYFKDNTYQSYKWTVEYNNDDSRWRPQVYAVNDKNAVIANPDDDLKAKLKQLRETFKTNYEGPGLW